VNTVETDFLNLPGHIFADCLSDTGNGGIGQEPVQTKTLQATAQDKYLASENAPDEPIDLPNGFDFQDGSVAHFRLLCVVRSGSACVAKRVGAG
jgi:hypothetical protein